MFIGNGMVSESSNRMMDNGALVQIKSKKRNIMKNKSTILMVLMLSFYMSISCVYAGGNSKEVLVEHSVATAKAPMAEYLFESVTDNVTYDSSEFGNTANIFGISSISSPRGKGLLFNGKDSYVDCGNPPELNFGKSVSIECWVRPDALPAGEVGIAGKGVSAYGLTYYKNGYVYWYISSGTNHLTANLELGQWQHVAGTYDGTTSRLYLNGKQTGTKHLNVPVKTGGKFFIGATATKSGVFNGGIACVKVYDYALSAETIEAHFKGNSELIIEKPQPVTDGQELKGDGYTLKVAENGRMQVCIGDEWYVLGSSFSYPGKAIGWNHFGKQGDSKESAWQPKLVSCGKGELELSASGDNYSLRRMIRLDGNKFTVSDTIRNKTQENLGVLYKSDVTSPVAFKERLLSGDNQTSEQMAAENPTVFVAQSKSSLGWLAEDAILRLQLSTFARSSQADMSALRFALPPGQSYTFKWSVYPQKAGSDYWTFINQVRRDWKVNTQVIGPFMWRGLTKGEFMKRLTDPVALRQYLTRERAQVVALMPWLDYDNFNALTGKPATRAETKALFQEAYKAIKAVNPQIKVIGCIEGNIVTLPDELALEIRTAFKGRSSGCAPCSKEQMEILGRHMLRWQDCLLKNKQGNHLLESYYRGSRADYQMLAIGVIPALNNGQHLFWLDQAKFLLEDVGLDGLYIDQFNLAFGNLQRYSYDKWDGVTVDIDPATGEILRKYTDGAWVSVGAQKNLVDYVMKKGSYMVANTHPAEPVMQAAGIHRFYECEFGVDPRTWADGEEPPLMNSPAKGHLSTPIALGYRPNFRGNRPEESKDYAHTVMKAAIAYLRHGLLYYSYANEIPETGPGAGEYGPINEMFPCTPVELHKGWILGEERIVTAVSGDFPWRQERRPEVIVFDMTGRAIAAKSEITKSERGWSVKIKLQDWQNIAVVK